MRINRSQPEKHFTQIPNAALRDERLSYTARGVLAEMLSRPDGWDTSADQMSDRARLNGREARGEGRRAIRAAFAELEAAGYLRRERVQIDGGKFVTEMFLTDEPNRGTASGMPVPPAAQPCSPSSDRRTANRRSVSGTSNRTTSTNTEDGLKDMASRRARAKRERVSARTIDEVIEATRDAAVAAYGSADVAEVTDDEWLGLYFTHKGKTEIRDVRAYAGKIFRDAPDLDTFLAKSEPVCVSCVKYESDCQCAA